jgi:hypothetical protein
MIVGNALIKKLVEGCVGVMRSSIDTNARVLILNTGEDASFKSNALSARHVFVFFPNFFSQAFGELGLGSWGEEGLEFFQFFSTVESSLVFLGCVSNAVFGSALSHFEVMYISMIEKSKIVLNYI